MAIELIILTVALVSFLGGASYGAHQAHKTAKGT
jgi:hypothetical protein